MLNLFLNLSSHPLDAVNSESPSSSLAHLAFSCNIGPVTGMFLILALWYHSYIASSIFCVCDALAGLESAFLFALYSSSISVLLAKIDWICDLPQSNFSAIARTLAFGFSLFHSMTWTFSETVKCSLLRLGEGPEAMMRWLWQHATWYTFSSEDWQAVT